MNKMIPRYVIEPLKEDHARVYIRTTELESFSQCPYRYKYAPQPDPAKDSFVLWNSVDTVSKTLMMTGSRCSYILYPRHQSKLSRYENLVEPLNTEYESVTCENKQYLDIEVGEFLVTITWTPDIVVKDKNTWDMWILDFKCYKQERKDEDIKKKMQYMIYPILMNNTMDHDAIKFFEYIVMTQHVTPRLQRIKIEFDKTKFTEKFEETVKDFVESVYFDNYKTKTDTHCFRCPLKGNWCPSHRKK